MDDTGVNILLNGISSGDTGSGSGGTWNNFTLTGLVHPGSSNTLDFIVNNAGSSNNPTGLRVEYSAVTFTPVPEPAIAWVFAYSAVLLRYRRRDRQMVGS